MQRSRSNDQRANGINQVAHGIAGCKL
jgi:hypothetical protein